MNHIKRIAAGTAIAAALGFAAMGVGTSVANAAPPVLGTQFAEWGHGPWGGPGGPWGGPGWGPPPPPPPYYGYGGYGGGYDQPCLTGPLGFLRLCP